MEQHPSLQNEAAEDDRLNLREELEKYIAQWKWFLLSVIMCVVVSGLYLRYTIPQYQAAASILVKDDRKGGLQSEMSAFGDLGLLNGVKSNVDNETEIIKSRSIIEKAVKKLNFNIRYFTEGRVKDIELYNDLPLEISFFALSDAVYMKDQAFI